MVQTIGNPASWSARQVQGAGKAVSDMTGGLRSQDLTLPEINTITLDDIRTALRLGRRDAARFRSDVAAIALIYPILGITLAYLAFHQALTHLLFPLAAGFALIGPDISGIAIKPTQPVLHLNMHAVTSNLFPTSHLSVQFQQFLAEFLKDGAENIARKTERV